MTWQPIETAPAPNLEALLWFEWEITSSGKRGCILIGAKRYDDDGVLAWRDEDTWEVLGEPTHWMPLPEPPLP